MSEVNYLDKDGVIFVRQKIAAELALKQDSLVSGQNIKTVNGQNLLGAGDIVIGGGEGGTTDYNGLTNKPQINGHELVGNQTAAALELASADQGAKADTAVQPDDLADFATSTDVATAISNAKLNAFQVVAELPETGDDGVTYLVGAAAPYEKFIWEGSRFISLGTTEDINLDGYVLATDLVPITNAEIDEIWAD